MNDWYANGGKEKDGETAVIDAPQPKATRAAGMEFPDDQFVTLTDIPVFAQHRTESAAEPGRVLDFGPQELAAVCARCNRRIIETGDYAAIVIGHTPSPEEKAQGAPDPELIGLAGPWRMGTIGTGDKKRACILVDFHVYKEDLGKLRKYPRRSPELWMEALYEDMFLDPIALLGAEAPRLDMGLLYAKGASPDRAAARMKFLGWAITSGRKVERYAASCAAMPSASNTHLLTYAAEQPSDKITPAKAEEMLANPPHGKPLSGPQERMLQAAAHKDDYAAGAEPINAQAATGPGQNTAAAEAVSKTNPKEPGIMAITPEDCRTIVEMLLATDMGQWITKKMAEDQGSNAIVPGESEPPADGDTSLAGQGEADLTPDVEAPGTAGEVEGIPPSEKPHPFEGPEPPEADAPEPNAGAEASIPPASTPSPEKPQPGAPPAAPKAEEPPREKNAADQGMEPEQYAAACASMDKVPDKDLEKYLAGRFANHPKHAKYAAEAFGSVGTKVPEGDMEGETSGGKAPGKGDAEGGDANAIPRGTAAGREGNQGTTIAGSAPKTKNLVDVGDGSGGQDEKGKENYAKRFESLQSDVSELRKQLAGSRHRERYSRLREATQTRVVDLGEEMERTKDMADSQFEDHMKVIREHYEKIPVGYYAVPDAPTDFQAEPTNTAHGQPEKYRASNVKKAEAYCERRKAEGKNVEFGEILTMLEAGQPLPV